MINGISGYVPFSTYGAYGASYASRAAQSQGADKVQAAQRSGMVQTARKIHQPDTPVQPVTPARPVSADEDPAQAGLLRFGSDPVEMAVRMRIQQPGDSAQAADSRSALSGAKAGADAQAPKLPGDKGRDDAQLMGLKADEADRKDADRTVQQSKSAQEVMEEAECQTCKERKYQDGSDDPGVSFKTPTNISPEQAVSAVRGHENEHVVREQAKARQEDRKVVSQSVTYHTDICPECGKVYVAGGETRTVTKANTDQQAQQQSQQEEQDPRKPFAAVA